MTPAERMERPRISILIVLYNALTEAAGCLESIFETGADGVEVIVVDNASPQGGAAILKERWPQVRLIQNEENVGFARAVNQAAGLAKGRYLLLLNPDCRLNGDVPRVLADWLEARPEVGLVGPRLLNPDGSLQTSTYAFPTLFQTAAHFFRLKSLLPLERLRRVAPAWLAGRIGQLNRHDKAGPVDYCTGAALMVRREVWDALGGLDERFFLYYEEKDLCLRAKQAGYETWLAPEASVVHRIGASSDTAAELATLARYRSMLAYFAKHHPEKLAALRLVMKAGAAFRHALAGLAGKRDEARVWRRVFRLADGARR